MTLNERKDSDQCYIQAQSNVHQIRRERRIGKTLRSLQAANAINFADIAHIRSWIIVTSAIACSGDLVKEHYWVFAKSPIVTVEVQLLYI